MHQRRSGRDSLVVFREIPEFLLHRQLGLAALDTLSRERDARLFVLTPHELDRDLSSVMHESHVRVPDQVEYAVSRMQDDLRVPGRSLSRQCLLLLWIVQVIYLHKHL